MKESLARKRLQALLVTSLANVRYLSGFEGSNASLLIARNKTVFMTDFRYRDQAEMLLERSGKGPAGKLSGGWEIVLESQGKARTIGRLIASLGIRTLGFEQSVSYEFFQALSRLGIVLRPVKYLIERLRTVKDAEETGMVREAVRRAEAAYRMTRPFIRIGKTELTLALMLEEQLRKAGCRSIPFDIIVASGENSALPHARASEKKLAAGDFVVLDWGGEAGGYFSDMTRTVLLRGKDLSKKREIYEQVLKANRTACSSVTPGATARSIDRAARDCIKKAGYATFFGHGTGHGVGLQVHELPRISQTGAETIRENMIFTVEPGIYLPGLGGVRIEDMVRVTSRGREILTALPRELDIV